MATITLSSVTAAVDGALLLRNVDLSIGEGELLVLIGRSGAGKSSIIRAIAGLVPVIEGQICFDGLDVSGTPTRERDLAIVFQGEALFANHDVRANIGFPLRVRKMGPAGIAERVMAEARALGVDHLLVRWPAQLSAGQRQLVQLARAVVRRPRVLLMDEPLANVDIETKAMLRNDIRTLQRGYGVTTVYATNDPIEALEMADRLAVVDGGRITQVGTTDEVRAAPVDRDTAVLTGAVVFIDAVVTTDGNGYWLESDGVRLRAWSERLAPLVGSPVTVGLRPEHVVAGRDVPGTILSRSIEDRRAVTRIDVGGLRLVSNSIDGLPGDGVVVSLAGGLVFGPDGGLVATVG